MQSITSLQQRRVSVTEESVAIRESMVVHGPPVAPEECRDQKDEGAFRLVEIGDKDTKRKRKPGTIMILVPTFNSLREFASR